MPIRGFRDLEVYQEGLALVPSIYAIANDLPSSEQYGLSDQMRRAAVSVVANIAEGYGRYGFQDRAQFCIRARGSLNETLDQIYVALDEGYIDSDIFERLYEQGRRVEKVLNGYISHLRRKSQG